MREVNKESFAALETALNDCLLDMRNVQGLLIAPPVVNKIDIENAAVIALSSLCRDYVRPNGVQFISGDKCF